MSDDKELDAARRDAEAARAHMLGTAHELQARLSPSNLAEDAIVAARAKGVAAIEVARRNPIAVSAAALGVVALIARRPIIGLFRRLHGSPPSSR